MASLVSCSASKSRCATERERPAGRSCLDMILDTRVSFKSRAAVLDLRIVSVCLLTCDDGCPSRFDRDPCRCGNSFCLDLRLDSGEAVDAKRCKKIQKTKYYVEGKRPYCSSCSTSGLWIAAGAWSCRAGCWSLRGGRCAALRVGVLRPSAEMANAHTGHARQCNLLGHLSTQSPIDAGILT